MIKTDNFFDKIIKKLLFFIGKEVIVITNKKLQLTQNQFITTPPKLEYQTPKSYPVFLKSNAIDTTTLEIVTRHDKGLLEAFFLDYLNEFVPYEVKTNLKIFAGRNYFIPDFVILSDEQNIRIIIEIDEPYSIGLGGNLIPIHYKGVDDFRNTCLIDNGWTIIRFAEEQIAVYPHLCCEYILKISENIECKLPQVNCWSEDEARKMIESKFRNSYLPIEFRGVTKATNFSYRSLVIESILVWDLEPDKKWIYVNLKKCTSEDVTQSDLCCRIDYDEFMSYFNNTKYFKEIKEIFDYRQVSWAFRFIDKSNCCRLNCFGIENGRWLNKKGKFELIIPDKISVGAKIWHDLVRADFIKNSDIMDKPVSNF